MLKDLYKEILANCEKYETLRKEISKKMSEADKEVSAIYHKIEFEKVLSASEGYKKYRELRKTLIKRRKIKGEYLAINLICEHNFSEKNKKKLEELIDQSQGKIK